MQQKRKFSKPKVVISRCIEHDPVRYNGDMISSPEVAAMKSVIEFIPVCPEVEIGLGIPRSSIRIVRTSEGDRLIQPTTERDLTDVMNAFSDSFFDSLSGVDGFILKNKSPTSGISNVNIYPTSGKSHPIEKGPGFFGGKVLIRYLHYPIEDEGRIRNQRIREHFLTRIFMLSDLRKAENTGTIKSLVQFHTDNKLLLTSYSQAKLKLLGQIVANPDKNNPENTFVDYRNILLQATRLPPRFTAQINVLLHAIGYLSKELNHEEKSYFLDQIEAYRRGVLPLTALRIMLQTWLITHPSEYLKNQTWFAPYPDVLGTLPPEEIERGREMY